MKYLILLLLIPVGTFGQQPDTARLYLTLNNQLTTHRNGLECKFNNKLSKSYVLTYDCYNTRHQLVKQLNRKPRLYDNTYSALTQPYFKMMPNSITDTYLIGDLKNGKPYNGFFIYPGTNIWLIFDFYQNGKRLFQVFNDLLPASRVKDTENSFTAISKKNTFVNGRLQSGIEVTPVTVKKGIVDIIREVDQYQTVGYILTMYSNNNPENLEIKPVNSGYQLACMGKNSIDITYSKIGKKIVFYDWKGRKVSKTKHPDNEIYSVALEKLAEVLKFKSVDADALKRFVREQW
ncbi:hypothetical protein ABIB62_004095 [Mucilaginibacter sp. UYP25]|uniref:hypothetical protein n=1 Tax=unclassified Mucilaginibacter TaxID=2617802 RepID=UPI00339480B8